jgi:predicted ATPase
MRFSRISLENWRNFGHVDVPLQTRAFLVGPNASGKSNLLESFRFLRDLVTPGSGFQRAVADRGGVSSIRNLATRRSSDIVIEVDLREGKRLAWRYRIAFTQDRQRRPVVKEEKVWRSGKLMLDRPNDDDRFDERRLQQTYLEQTVANRRFRPIADFFASIHYYHLVPQLVRDPERSIGRRADPYGGDFLEQMALTSKRTRDSRLRRILAAIKVATPHLSEIKLDRDEHGVQHLYCQCSHWPGRAWHTEADLSDGSLRLIGLLWALLHGNGPLLLEEPELSLHPSFVRHLPAMMWRIRRPAIRQMFLSTHSSDLLRDEGITADEVLLFFPTPKGVDIKASADIPEFQHLLETGLSAAEVVIPHTRPPDAVQLPLIEN